MKTLLTVAVLGATSHIAKGLVSRFLNNPEVSLHLYARRLQECQSFIDRLEKHKPQDFTIHQGYEHFFQPSYDVIINCVGVGVGLRGKARLNYTDYFLVTEKYDNLIIDYLTQKNPDVLYICFSSGAVYGKGFLAPAKRQTVNNICPNHIKLEDSYSIAKLNSEAKHRAFADLNIVDLRLFSYFSRYVDLKEKYLITAVLDCVLHKKCFITNNANIVRDYIHPEDLYLLILSCVKARKINAAFDVISKQPVSKIEIIDYFSKMHDLKYKITDSISDKSSTGLKENYYSEYNMLSKIDFKPQFKSIDAIKQESYYILEGGKEVDH